MNHTSKPATRSEPPAHPVALPPPLNADDRRQSDAARRAHLALAAALETDLLMLRLCGMRGE